MAVMATGYSGASGIYPLALSIVMALLGLAVVGRALLHGTDASRQLVDHMGRLMLTVAAGAVYLVLVPLLGFYTASALLIAVLPLLLGFRQPVYLAAVTLIFMVIVWAIFSQLLQKPLPAEFWDRIG